MYLTYRQYQHTYYTYIHTGTCPGILQKSVSLHTGTVIATNIVDANVSTFIAADSTLIYV